MRERVLFLVALVALSGSLFASPVVARPARAENQERIVFIAQVKGSGDPRQAVYVADGNGGNVRRLPLDQRLTYDWAAWAMNGTKIVYTARDPQHTPPTASIYMMDADGSNQLQLTDNPVVNAQPKVSPDGHYLIFSAGWEEFPKAAIFRMDLATLQVENLSARAGTKGGFDTDPKLSVDGKQIAFVFAVDVSIAKTEHATQIQLMGIDGLGRRRLTSDFYFNTDPSVAPDGKHVAYSSYRGSRDPVPPDAPPELSPWHLVVVDVNSLEQRVLTKGFECVDLVSVCGPADGPGFVAQWSPDGQRIGYISIRSALFSGIYVMDADGRNAQPLIETLNLGINWWDWTAVREPPSGAVQRIGGQQSGTRLLYGGRVTQAKETSGVPLRLFVGRQDRWTSSEVSFQEANLELRSARWSPDRRQILVTARSAAIVDGAPYPAPPQGEQRHIHFTLDEFGRAQAPEAPISRASSAARDQIYLGAADGSDLRQITTPWIEDYMDALPSDDPRGNTDPDLSPDGRYLVFTNSSTVSFESFILRLDLQTGDVLNLTSVTAGARAVADSRPRFSPDGKTIAFVSAVGDVSSGLATTQIFLMDADGLNVRQLTDDTFFNIDPTWSPDGSWMAFSSYRGDELLADPDAEPNLTDRTVPLQDWVLVKMRADGRDQTELTSRSDPPVFRPVWHPDGHRIGFISVGPTSQPDIYVIGAAGGTAWPLQATVVTKEEFFDWR